LRDDPAGVPGAGHALSRTGLRDENGRAPNRLLLDWAIAQAHRRADRVVFGALHHTADAPPALDLRDEQGRHWTAPVTGTDSTAIWAALRGLRERIGQPLALFPAGSLAGTLREQADHPQIRLCPQVYHPVLPGDLRLHRRPPDPSEASDTADPSRPSSRAPYLRQLEAQSIHILREAVAQARRPVMLYSIGKDSGVMLHLARKAFHPAPPPFPLLHIDTRWKFQEMYLFRDFVARHSGMEMLVHVNPQAIERDINPFDHGSALHTDITKTEALKQALDRHGFDVIFGGARRDEERSRAKERIFSFRSATHRWDPKNQRPELWNLYNTRRAPGHSVRVFPLSNWTETDIWHYIHQEQIPVVPLYLARPRAVVVREQMIMVVDDERCRLRAGEEIQIRQVRMRSLGCYPLSAAVQSQATTLREVVLEVAGARQSERQGRLIDADGAAAMERKKVEGYF
jgi:sulfate adenylyltransferase subunit 2